MFLSKDELSRSKKFYIQEIDISGDKRTSFLIQKKKFNDFSNEDSDNKLKLLMNLDKNKTIHEKNIQNKVTKYKLYIISKQK